MLVDELANLIQLIPEIECVGCGKNLTDRANGLTHGAVVTLASKDALTSYISHPAHVSIREKLR